LDPADANYEAPGQLVLFRGERPVVRRFFGSLDPARAPHVLVHTLASAMAQLGDSPLVQAYAYRPSPLLRQTLLLLAQLLQPERILIAEGTSLDQSGFPIGPETVALGAAFPPLVQGAQRKAHWMKLLEQSSDQEVDLSRVTLEGARLGSGQDCTSTIQGVLRNAPIARAETCGSSLLLVSPQDLDETEIARAMDATSSRRVHLTHPDAYQRVLCSFARQSGEDFAMGVVEQIDWERWTARVRSTAVPPAPVRILRLGSIRLDGSGNEHQEAAPWSI
jgi:hypothetical protein